MGLFDGVVVRFADKLCDHLEARKNERIELAKQLADDSNPQAPYLRLLHSIVAEALAELVAAIRSVKEQ